jgi:hypothetical protein
MVSTPAQPTSLKLRLWAPGLPEWGRAFKLTRSFDSPSRARAGPPRAFFLPIAKHAAGTVAQLSTKVTWGGQHPCGHVACSVY